MESNEVQTDKGQKISKAEAAAKMFGRGSKQHLKAIENEKKGDKK